MSFKFGTVVLETEEGVEISADADGKLQMKLSVGEAGDVDGRIILPVGTEVEVAILKELKIMNIHLSLLTDNIITKEDID